ncbi:alpha/beta hydrolase family protein [Haloferula sp.]|uniref:alpha/beta hydrolase family protein n=1 Tax=Haloferula sp. TaxID=2497595 RepID=UPI003C764D21
MMTKSKSYLSQCVGIALAAAGLCHADDFSAQRQLVENLAGLTDAPSMREADGFPAVGGIKAVYFEALDWKGQPTAAFAWLGVPKNSSGKVPGIVLVHGGGGSAFQPWVRQWNDRGFAAISIAVEGQTSERAADNPKAWKRHESGGPGRVGIYGDSSEPIADQWMYHAVANTVLANSLLRSLPGVDPEKIGIMGVSWGGVITSTVIGIDTRFAFGIPTYGCGDLSKAGNQYGRALGNNLLYQKVWDPLLRLDRAKLPVLWFSWPQDQHFPLDCQAACYRRAPGAHMVALVPKMGHGHGPAWNRAESYAFAESIVGEGTPWCVQASAGADGSSARVAFTSSKPLDRAVLVSTTDSGITGSRKWVESPAKLVSEGGVWLATATIPEGTTAWFINVHSGALISSSEYQIALSPKF